MMKNQQAPGPIAPPKVVGKIVIVKGGADPFGEVRIVIANVAESNPEIRLSNWQAQSGHPAIHTISSQFYQQAELLPCGTVYFGQIEPFYNEITGFAYTVDVTYNPEGGGPTFQNIHVFVEHNFDGIPPCPED